MMFKRRIVALALCSSLSPWAISDAAAASDADLQAIRQEIDQLKQNYETRIRDLENRLQKAEATANTAQTTAQQANVKADEASAQASAPNNSSANSPSNTPAEVASAAPSNTNSFNPDISLILSGIYSNLSQNPENYRITGFIPGGDIGPGDRGLSLSESELGVYASVDPWFYGGLNLSLHSDNTMSVEEAFIQTTALPDGIKVKAGRFFSGIGYMNEQHSHVWDFVDSPLAYQAFLGSQYNNDGVQTKWLLPTDQFIELGAEIGRGSKFPGTDNNNNSAGSYALYGHTGGDVGVSNSWRAGLSYMYAKPQDREYNDADIYGASVNNTFSGNSNLLISDFVWKWAPNGNAERTNFKLQGEYLYRTESGSLAYDIDGPNSSSAYSSRQSGWYLQGVYQFMPAWRVGVRYDQLYDGMVNYGSNGMFLTNPGYDPHKATVMFDWTPSEFSRIRLQYAQDKSHQGVTDNQIFLQYQMSLGAHGAHSF